MENFGRDLYEPIHDGFSTRFEADLAEIEDLEENISQRSKKKSVDHQELGFEVPEYIMNADDKSEFDIDEVNDEEYEYDRFNLLGPSAPRAHLTSKEGASNFDIWPAPLVSGFDRMKKGLEDAEPHTFDSLDAMKKAKKKAVKDFETRLKRASKRK